MGRDGGRSLWEFLCYCFCFPAKQEVLPPTESEDGEVEEKMKGIKM